MNSDDAGIKTDKAAGLELAVEWWRLDRWLSQIAEPTGQARARRFRRTVDSILAPHGIEVRDFTGQPLTEGLAVEVVEVVDDVAAPDGPGVIVEMLSPTISQGDSVIQYGQAVVRRRPNTSTSDDQGTKPVHQKEILSAPTPAIGTTPSANHRKHKKGHKRG